MLNIFKIECNWFEGEHDETLLAKKVESEEFEKDLTEARIFAEDFKNRKYRTECLPEFYEQIVNFLIKKKGHKECNFDEDISYDLDDYPNKKIEITKVKRNIERIRVLLSTNK